MILVIRNLNIREFPALLHDSFSLHMVLCCFRSQQSGVDDLIAYRLPTTTPTHRGSSRLEQIELVLSPGSINGDVAVLSVQESWSTVPSHLIISGLSGPPTLRLCDQIEASAADVAARLQVAHVRGLDDLCTSTAFSES